MYLSSKPDTSLSCVALTKSHGKKYQNYFYVTTSLFAEMWLDEMLMKKRIKKKDDGFWLLTGKFNEYFKQNIIMAELKKANFHSVDICKSII